MPASRAVSSDGGLPPGLPHRVYATWTAALSEIHATDNARHAAERYQFLCGFGQALTDLGIVAEGDYAEMRAKLMEAWVSAVNRVDQSSSLNTPPIY